MKRSPATNSVDVRCNAGCAGSRLGGPELQASCIGSWRQMGPRSFSVAHGMAVPTRRVLVRDGGDA